jgi:hypothetical protein
VHVRHNYATDTSHLHEEENAIRCASTLQQQLEATAFHNQGAPSLGEDVSDHSSLGSANISNTNVTMVQPDPAELRKVSTTPIYVASDMSSVTRRAIIYGQQHQLHVVGRYTEVNASDPLHIDRDLYNEQQDRRPPSDFYDTFVDLYLLTLGQCFTWGKGGYGSWAGVIGGTVHNAGICGSIVHTRQQCAFAI